MTARAEINTQALRNNLQQVRNAAPERSVMAVIKADAYGHGLVSVARALEQADGFAVACLAEAQQLRDAGIQKPLLLLQGVQNAAELEQAQQLELELVVHRSGQIGLLEQAASTAPIKVWLKVDTGMHRLGVTPREADDCWQRLLACRSVDAPPRLMTHLANADNVDDQTTQRQVNRFYDLPMAAAAECSIANSAGILAWPTSHADWVRPGIMLYGVSPFPNGEAALSGLQPVMTLTSQLIAVKTLLKGATVGYSGIWECPEDMPVGIVAIGYGDGYPRHAVSGTPVLVNGQRVPLIGRVSMDMLCVDLRTVPEAHVGDYVTLWGEGLAVEEVARYAGTIGYELLCQLTGRVVFDMV